MRRLRRFALSTIFFAPWVSAIRMVFHVRFVWPRSFLLFLVFYRAQQYVRRITQYWVIGRFRLA